VYNINMNKIISGSVLIVGVYVFTRFIDLVDKQNFSHLWENFFIPELLLFFVGFFLIWLGVLEKAGLAKWLKYISTIILAAASFYLFAKIILNL